MIIEETETWSEESYEPVILDEFHYHEALDRTYIFTAMLNDNLLSHSVYQQNDKLKEKLEKAIELLAELYQEIGADSIRLFD